MIKITKICGHLVFALMITVFCLFLSNETAFGVNTPTPGGSVSKLSFTSVSQTLGVNKNGTLSAFIDPQGSQVSSMELVISFDPGIIRVDNVTPGPFFTYPNIGAPVDVIKNINNTTGKIHYALGFPLGSNYSSTTAKIAAVISFTTIGSGTSPVTYVTTGVPSTKVSDLNALNVLGSVDGATITVTADQTQTPSPTPVLTLSPTNPQTTPTPSQPLVYKGCINSSGNWKNIPFAKQTGIFTAEFDATANSSVPSMANFSYAGFSAGVKYDFTALAGIVSFDPTGHIRARNANQYTSYNLISYTFGRTYHFRFVIDVPHHTYSVYVTPNGGSERLIGQNLAFRVEQKRITYLDTLEFYARTQKRSLQICDLVITPSTIGQNPVLTPAPTSLVACNKPGEKWASDLGLIKDKGHVEQADGAPYFVPSDGSFTVQVPSGNSVSSIACYDCDHYGEDATKGWNISWNGGSFIAKTPGSTWKSWSINIPGYNNVLFDGGGDSHGGNACINTNPPPTAITSSTPTPTFAPNITATPTTRPTITVSPTPTPRPTNTSTPTPTLAPNITATPTTRPTITVSPTPTPRPTNTVTPKPTTTPTPGIGASLSLIPATQTLSSGVGGVLNAFIGPNSNNVSAVELVISFNPGIIRVDNIAPGPFFTDPGIGAPVEIIKIIDNTSGKIHYAVGFPLGSGYSSTSEKIAAVISFTTIGPGTSPATYITAGVPSTKVSDINALNVLGSVTGANIIVTTPSATPTPKPSITVSPSPTPFEPTPTPVLCVPTNGDADGDGDADMDDYNVWNAHYNSATENGPSDGDFNCSGFVDGVDYTIWLNAYNISITPTITRQVSSTPTPTPKPTATISPPPVVGANLSLIPANQTLATNQTANLNIFVAPVDKMVSSMELVITFNPAMIRVNSITYGPFFTDPGIGTPIEILKNIDNTAGKIHYALGFPLGSGYSSTSEKIAAVISFTTLTTGTSQVSFVTAGNPSTKISDINALNVLNLVNGASILVQ